jgi:TonB family protein
MRRPWATLALLAFCLAISSHPSLQGQSRTPPENHAARKVIRNPNPDYPQILKTKGIGGVVRLNARVLADGTVAHVQILGGNPILATCAAIAVMGWRYAPAASPSDEIVVLNFNPH